MTLSIVWGLFGSLLSTPVQEVPPHDSILSAIQRETENFGDYLRLEGKISIQDYEPLCPMTVNSVPFRRGRNTHDVYLIRARILYIDQEGGLSESQVVELSNFYSNDLLFGLSRADLERNLAITREAQSLFPGRDYPLGFEWRAHVVPDVGIDCSQSELTLERDDMARMRTRLFEILDRE